MINLKRILVPTDFSECARHALTYGFSFAKEYDAELLLLHVVETLAAPYASDLFPVPMAEVFEEMSGYAKSELEKLVAEAKGRGLSARFLVAQGKPSFEMDAKVAGEKGAPRLYIVGRSCPELVEQVKAAPLLPLDSGKTGAGEIVHPDWETTYGHAHAALRYGVMSRPGPSEEPDLEDDPRRALLKRVEKRWESGEPAYPPRLIYV